MLNSKFPIYNNPLKNRSDVQEAVNQLCDPLKPHFSEGNAWLQIGNTSASYSTLASYVEAFARPLWGLAPLLAGGGSSDIWTIYLKGIRNGTNTEHPEYWGELSDYDQRMVEMAAIGLALAITPDKIWEPLNRQEKDNFARWLSQINLHPAHDNNWLLFKVLVNIGLKKVGEQYCQGEIDSALEHIEKFYLSDGWYSDGLTDQRDYYVSFAIHYYTLIYAKVMESDDPERSQRYKERAAQFAREFIYWFSADGSSIPFGRSLTYRFAQTAFWGAMAFSGVEGFSWGVVKGIFLRHLRWWLKKPIFTTDGILSLGYAYSNLHMCEGYNAPGSPYWAMKAFLPLALGVDHPFWKAEEEALPELKSVSVQSHPHMVICRDKDSDHVFALTSGQYARFEPAHVTAKYCKFAYSNIFGFSVSRSDYKLSHGAYDSALALSEDDYFFRTRRKCEEYRIEGQVIYSRWKPWNDVEVKTWLMPALPWHVRIHCINSQRHLNTAEGGFAIATESNLVKPDSNYKFEENNGIAAKYPWGISGIVNLRGNRRGELIEAEPNTNLMAPLTCIPTLIGHLDPGVNWIVCAVFASPNAATHETDWQQVPGLTIESDELIIKHKNIELFRVNMLKV